MKRTGKNPGREIGNAEKDDTERAKEKREKDKKRDASDTRKEFSRRDEREGKEKNQSEKRYGG